MDPTSHRPSLVFLPGQLSTARLWRDSAHALADVADALIADQNRGDTVQAIASAVLEQCPPQFVLAAHGMAGFVAFEMLRRAPQRFLGVALCGTLAPADNEAQTARRRRYLELLAAGRFPEIVEERIPTVLHPARLQEPDLVEIVRRMALETGAERFAAQTRAIMGRPDSRNGLAAIPCPAALIWGRQDGMASEAQQREMLAAIPDASLHVLEDTGHFSPLERPAQVAAILRDLVLRVRNSP